jgi:hypothetical protein
MEKVHQRSAADHLFNRFTLRLRLSGREVLEVPGLLSPSGSDAGPARAGR